MTNWLHGQFAELTKFTAKPKNLFLKLFLRLIASNFYWIGWF